MSYQDFEQETWVEKTHDFFTHHTWLVFFLGCLVGMLVKPILIGIWLVIYLMCIFW